MENLNTQSQSEFGLSESQYRTQQYFSFKGTNKQYRSITVVTIRFSARVRVQQYTSDTVDVVHVAWRLGIAMSSCSSLVHTSHTSY